MRLSPFDTGTTPYEWVADAPLYGRSTADAVYEIKVYKPGDEPADATRIARPSEDIEPPPPDFDIAAAEKSLEYVKVANSYYGRFRWLTHKQFKDEFFYPPDNPPRPPGVPEDEWRDHWEKELRGRGDQRSIHLNSDTEALLRRFARLWNGDEVRGVHLLRDKCPSIQALIDDLDEDRIARFYYDTTRCRTRDNSRKLYLAFGEFDWFPTYDPYFTDTYLLKKHVWYQPTQRVKTLISENTRFPPLTGDRYERLPHRFTVGLGALYCALAGDGVKTYHNHHGYNLDIAATSQTGVTDALEVITGHNGVKHNRDTYRKLRALNQHGITPIVIFDTRETAYNVMNDWHRNGIAELPYGPYNTNPNIPTGRKHIQRAYHATNCDWSIADWHTTTSLWRITLGADGPDNAASLATALTW